MFTEFVEYRVRDRGCILPLNYKGAYYDGAFFVYDGHEYRFMQDNNLMYKKKRGS